jgi:hypothetical protein
LTYQKRSLHVAFPDRLWLVQTLESCIIQACTEYSVLHMAIWNTEYEWDVDLSADEEHC